jgi:hypothetical protein
MRNSFVIARLLLIHLVSNTLHGLAKSEFFFFGGASGQRRREKISRPVPVVAQILILHRWGNVLGTRSS